MCTSGILFVGPATPGKFVAFLIVTALFAAVFAGIIRLNQSAAAKIEQAATQLTAS